MTKANILLKSGLCFVALSSLIFGIAILQTNSLKKTGNIQDVNAYLKEQEQLSAAANIQKQLPSFGFDNLLADWTFLQFVQYFGDGEAREVTGYSTVTDYFEDIVNRDPNFIQSHFVMSSANSLFAAQPDKTVDLLNQALETLSPKAPNYPFLVWTYKATDEILFLGDIEAARNSYATAAKWASEWESQKHDSIGDEMAERFNKTANFLASDPNPAQAQFGAWMNNLTTAKDPKTQNYILNRLKELGAEINTFPNGRLDIKPPKFNQT